jgi:hypothetical protein
MTINSTPMMARVAWLQLATTIVLFGLTWPLMKIAEAFVVARCIVLKATKNWRFPRVALSS